MQKRRLYFILVTLFIGAYCFFSLQKEKDQPTALSKLDTKYIPSEQFFLQRAFPDATVDLAAYTAALTDAQLSANSRSNLNDFPNDWQSEGPGNLGARVNTIAVHPTNDNIIFAGYSGGGIFRTMNGGTTWQPVFDDQLFLAIGDLVFDPQDANTIYAGTGDPNVSGFPFLGDGLYRSTDLGENWEYIGLEELRIISKIIIHPTDNQTIYVAAMGLPFEPNTNKGLYKTTDGGENWEQVLFLGGITGVIDVVFDRENPEILYAAGWDRLRNNQVSETRGQGAKIHRSMDGGDTWEQLTGGLPQDDQSRIGLATTSEGVVAVYVDVSHNFQGLYQTNDNGESWIRLPSSEAENGFNEGIFAGFGWYFAKVRVNPTDDQDISILGVPAFRTRNGGQDWEPINALSTVNVHSDVHDLVFTSTGKMLMGTDGGMYRFDEDGRNWEDIEDIPTTQIYRVAYNPHEPQNYYAGAQDNGTSSGNAQELSNWEKIFGGDGFQAVFHPTDEDIFYVEFQRGNIFVTVDGASTFESATEGIENNDRKNWDMQYIMSPHDPNVLYTGTQRVYISDVGPIPKWRVISPDLTNGETDGLSQTISTLHQSALDENILYVGTTDGNIWRTMNGGTNWSSLTGLPERYFTEVIASADIRGNVFATISGYRDNENTAHVYQSEDNGLTWRSIAGNLPPLAINAMQVIPGYEDKILFVGTDGGVYGTINGGESWERVGANMPIIAVYDLEWNRGENTLVAGTFARAVMSYSLEGIVAGDNLSSVDFKTQEASSLTVFPNPVAGDLTLSFTNNRPNQPVVISIFTLDGKLIKQAAQRTAAAVVWKVNVSDLPSGNYLVKLDGEFFSFSEQFVKI